MLNAVPLGEHSIAVDYTIHGVYLNDCRYFGNDKFFAWMNNINHYPNIIYNIDTALIYLSKYQIQSIMDQQSSLF